MVRADEIPGTSASRQPYSHAWKVSGTTQLNVVYWAGRGEGHPFRGHQRVMLTAPRVLGTGHVIVRRGPCLYHLLTSAPTRASIEAKIFKFVVYGSFAPTLSVSALA